MRFDPIGWWEFLIDRAKAYRLTFTQENKAAQEVLADLAEFCRAYKSTFHPDPRVHAALEGRREVWLRIAQHLHLDEDQLFKAYSRGVSFDPRKQTERDDG